MPHTHWGLKTPDTSVLAAPEAANSGSRHPQVCFLSEASLLSLQMASCLPCPRAWTPLCLGPGVPLLRPSVALDQGPHKTSLNVITL